MLGAGLGNIWYLWQRQGVGLAGEGLWAVFANLGDLRVHVRLREEEAVCREGVGFCAS